ncbi:hypothetical protein CCY01nite_07410 [Chitinophaga cymbidii]|uniref:HNH nuclease domain-containing protein n=1 Tax=Chitinophaga cymbidii TaxID=1096750 RepID=A0A512RFK7_9BACT|nr:hypothetical protein CCY01nite_07410 [Chitinophaga cymbidii]
MHWNRWAWEQAYGKIPPRTNVVFKDGNPNNLTIDNLELLSDAALAKRNASASIQTLSDNYIAGILSPKNTALRTLLQSNKTLLEIKRKQITLKRTIYGQQEN